MPIAFTLSACIHVNDPVVSPTYYEDQITKEEKELKALKEIASSMNVLIADYEVLLNHIVVLREERTAQELLQELAEFLTNESLDFIVDTGRDEIINRFNAKFSPTSLMAMRNAQLYGLAVDIVTRIVLIAHEVNYLLGLYEQGRLLEKHLNRIIKVIFPALATMRSLAIEQKLEFEQSIQLMDQIRNLEKKIQEMLIEWQQVIRELDRSIGK